MQISCGLYAGLTFYARFYVCRYMEECWAALPPTYVLKPCSHNICGHLALRIRPHRFCCALLTCRYMEECWETLPPTYVLKPCSSTSFARILHYTSITLCIFNMQVHGGVLGGTASRSTWRDAGAGAAGPWGGRRGFCTRHHGALMRLAGDLSRRRRSSSSSSSYSSTAARSTQCDAGAGAAGEGVAG
jgi:hypothetical protein